MPEDKSEYEDPDYDRFDVLVDTDPLALRDLARSLYAEVRALRGALYEVIVGANDDPAFYGVTLDHETGTATLNGGSSL